MKIGFIQVKESAGHEHQSQINGVSSAYREVHRKSMNSQLIIP